MDQQQIDIVHGKLTQTLVETGNRTILTLKLAIQLGCHKEFLTGNATVAHALAHAPLVAIAKGRVDVTIADFDGGDENGGHRFVVERSRA